MLIYRVFSWNSKIKKETADGGALYIPRDKQGEGRHDIPEYAGVMYCSGEVISAISETIQDFRGKTITNRDFELANEKIKALAALELADDAKIIDLRNAKNLMKYKINPVEVATHERETTKKVSERMYQEEAGGFIWWSAIESKWANLTLFGDRIKNKLKVKGPIKPLNTAMPEVVTAAGYLNINLE